MPGFAGLSTTPSDGQGSSQDATAGAFAGLARSAPGGNPIAEGVHNFERGASQMAGNVGRFLKEGTASNASALSQGLDYQRSRSQEATFHKGSSDANRAALRKSMPGFAAGYNDDTLGGSGDGKGVPIPPWLQHAIRGTEDFVLDTATDPLTYETLGMGPLLKGGAKIAGALARTGESIAPRAANTVRAATNLARENFSLGGRKIEELRRTHGQQAKDNVLGAMTHADAEGHHVKTLLQQRLDKAFKSLDHGQRAEVLKILNGESAMPKSGPIADAARSVRKTTDDQLYLQLTKKSRKVLPLARKGTANESISQRISEPTGTPVVRWERPNSTGEGSKLRGGKSFTQGFDSTNYLGGENAGKEGGLKRVTGYIKPKNPLIIEPKGYYDIHGSSAGGEAIKSLGDEKLKSLANVVARGDNPGAARVLFERVGLTHQEADLVMARAGAHGVLDRVGSELAKRAGHDSIIVKTGSNPEIVMLDPAAKAVKRVKKPGVINPESFEALSPERVGRGVRAKVGNLPEKKYNLPDNLKEFASVPGEATLKDFRRKYVSGLSMAEEGEPVDRDAFTSNPLNYQNPNLLARQDFKVDGSDPGKYIDALSRSADNASRNVGASRLQAKLTEAFGDNIPREAVDALEKTIHATGERRSNKEVVLDSIRGVTNYGKAATTQFSPMHAANVMALSLLHNPLGTHKVLGTAAKLIKNRGNAEKTYEILRPGIERGAIGPAKDHELKFGKVPGLGQWSKLMSDITWGVDNAAKTEYSKSLGKGYAAGRRASEDLIDYRYPSDFSRNIFSLASRFPTYRSQLMPAVLKGVARNPARAAALMRASGGSLTGDEVDVGGHKLKSFTSVADVGRGVGDPAGFARSSLGDLQKAALTFAGISHGRNPKYFTYGQDLNAKYISNALASGVPEGRTILDAMGLGLFPGNDAEGDLIFSLTGTGVK